MDELAATCEQICQSEWREKFLTEILKNEQEKATHYNVLTKETYSRLIEEVEEAEHVSRKTQMHKRRLKRFCVVEIDGMKKLVARNVKDDLVKFYLTADELYDVIDAAHVAVGHGGRDKLLAETSKNFANITKDMICLYLSMCKVCRERRPNRMGNFGVVPKLNPQMQDRNTLCRVNFIDFQTRPDGNFKFVMVYEDHLTKFIWLRPLESKSAQEVAYNLNDIFLTVGAPCVLQSAACEEEEFAKLLISKFRKLWPKLKIVQQPADEMDGRENRDVENMLSSWLKDNRTSKWSEGIKYVQYVKNQAFHWGINMSPYKAVFGTESKVGLSNNATPLELRETNDDEEDDRKSLSEDEKEDEIELSEDENVLPQSMLEIDYNPFSVHNDFREARTKIKDDVEKPAKKMKVKI